jgi:competence protein ComGC
MLIKEFFLFLRKEKKYWMIPMIIVLLILGTLVALAQGSVISPFIYTLF